MKIVFVKRRRPPPTRVGWTNADGTKIAAAPPNWPFGTAPVQPPHVSAAQPKNRRGQ